MSVSSRATQRYRLIVVYCWSSLSYSHLNSSNAIVIMLRADHDCGWCNGILAMITMSLIEVSHTAMSVSSRTTQRYSLIVVYCCSSLSYSHLNSFRCQWQFFVFIACLFCCWLLMRAKKSRGKDPRGIVTFRNVLEIKHLEHSLLNKTNTFSYGCIQLSNNSALF